MASLSRRRLITLENALATADTVSSYLALAMALLMLMSSMRDLSSVVEAGEVVRGAKLSGHRPCDELYVVGEGETLNTIGAKCEDPFIVERNPHVNDPDDVYPGLVLLIIPSKPK